VIEWISAVVTTSAADMGITDGHRLPDSVSMHISKNVSRGQSRDRVQDRVTHRRSCLGFTYSSLQALSMASAERGRRWMEEEFTWETVAREMLGLYGKLLLKEESAP
jgi:hypothetical protein